MSDNSKIEWTEATWNPVTGCTQISPGCAHCYAMRFANRFKGVAGHPYERGFEVQLRPERLRQPLEWTKPRRIFVNSMSDLFHDEVPEEYVRQVFDVMEGGRSAHVPGAHEAGRACASNSPPRCRGRPTSGSACRSRTSTGRAASTTLRAVPAAVRFLSCEPLLGPLNDLDLTGVHWVIAGGESGPGARRPKPEWFRSLRDQCAEAEVDFFFKQWGAFNADGKRVGKKKAGRELDGRLWDGMPVAA